MLPAGRFEQRKRNGKKYVARLLKNHRPLVDKSAGPAIVPRPPEARRMAGKTNRHFIYGND